MLLTMRLLIVLISFLGINCQNGTQNVIEVAQSLGLTTFVQYLNENGVSSEWADLPSINVFAPTDAAWQYAQDNGLLPTDPDDFRDLLVYHGVSGSTNGILTTDNFQNDALLESAFPSNYVRFNVYNFPGEDSAIYSTTGCLVDINQADNLASNGVVQVLVSVMVPPIYSINGWLGSNGNFSTFTRAINLARLDTLLQGEGNFTMFAPTDAAFNKMSQEDVDNLFANTDALTELVNYHLVESTYYSEGLYDGQNLTTRQGGSLSFIFSIEGIPGLYINNNATRLIKTDSKTVNGVVHVINSVLIPNFENVNDNDNATTGRMSAFLLISVVVAAVLQQQFN